MKPPHISETQAWAIPNSIEVDEKNLSHIVAGQCRDCEQTMFPRALVCPKCMGEEIQPFYLREGGVLYSFSKLHLARKGWQVPYVIGYVDFPEGVRVMGPVEMQGPFQPRCGSKVRVEIGTLRTGTDGIEYLSHRFFPID
jgi:uncharacterized OB-fold protein